MAISRRGGCQIAVGVILVMCSLWSVERAMSEEYGAMPVVAPPISDLGEVRLDDPQLYNECIAALGNLSESRLAIQTAVTSANAEWGNVFRADFEQAEFPDHRSRFVCWRKPEGGVRTLLTGGSDIVPLR